MIDPQLSLALSMHSNKGVYALMLGSGVSRAAQIPTGWEVVLDLIRKFAAMEGEVCEPHPEQWYFQKYQEGPNYSLILSNLKSPAERSQFLRSYFEPSEEDRLAGIKVPTLAHKAIAKLVQKGYVKVILTTNFDRLMERALEEVGIYPIVISTSDAAKGALPLIHSQCTIVKVHGDYLDTRIKNTSGELAKFNTNINKLLDRIFDEFGLITCGWSSDWDTALRERLERCQSRRFPTYWITRSTPSDYASRLINLRQAVVIKVDTADEFFDSLNDKILSLESASKPHPISARLAEETLKRLISNRSHDIPIHDLIMGETEEVYRIIEQQNCNGYQVADQVYWDRIVEYDGVSDILLSYLSNGAYWFPETQQTILIKSLSRLAMIPRNEGLTSLLNVRFYSALISMYAIGIGALYANNDTLFKDLTEIPTNFRYNERSLLIEDVHCFSVVNRDTLRSCTVLGEDVAIRINFLNEHLAKVLREKFQTIIPSEDDFIKAFDRFDYIRALIMADLNKEQNGRVWVDIGAFSWRSGVKMSQIIQNEIENESTNWPFLKMGLFGKSLERLLSAKKELDQFFRNPNF